MKRFPLLFLTALLGFVVSAPAQRSQQDRSGRVNRGAVVVNQQSRVDHSRHVRQARRLPRAQPGHSRQVVRGRHDRGRWVTRCERVLVPGYWTTQHVPAVFGWILDSCGHRHWGIVEAACSHRVWVPARYETQTRRVWVRH